MRPSKLIAPLGCALIVGALTLTGCAAAPEQEEDPVNINGGAERSYTDEELQDHEGGSYFPDTFTFDELLEDYKCELGQEQDGAFTAGAYLIGEEGSPAPGTYLLEGSQEKTGEVNVYMPTDEEGVYRIKFTIGYLGPTFVNLDATDAVFFKPPSDTDVMRAATDEPLGVTIPYESGLYRVGIDIPAGVYTVTQSEAEAPVIAAKAYQYPQVLVYSNLDFGTDNKLFEEDLPAFEEDPVAIEVTVEDGQFLELYGCTASPLAVP